MQTQITYHHTSHWGATQGPETLEGTRWEGRSEQTLSDRVSPHSTLIGVGFSSKSASLNRAPGWEPESWGYHGDDGHCFQAQNVGKHYGPTFGYGDVIGCGVNFRTGTAFFTKNGHYLGMYDEKTGEQPRAGPCPGPTCPLMLTLFTLTQESHSGKSKGNCTPRLGSKRPESMFVSTSARHRSCSTLIQS